MDNTDKMIIVELNLLTSEGKEHYFQLMKNIMGLSEDEIVKAYSTLKKGIKENNLDKENDIKFSLIIDVDYESDDYERLIMYCKKYNIPLKVNEYDEEAEKFVEIISCCQKNEKQEKKVSEVHKTSEIPSIENEEIIMKPFTSVCHYIKWEIDDDLSLRYYYSFEDRKNLANKYILKSHSEKSFEMINNEKIIKSLKRLVKKNPVEVIGRKLPNGKYMKHFFEIQSQSNINLKDEIIED
jgi:tetratricopeptide (TPR) repeat protein